MVHVIKVHLEDSKNEPQIRRLAVSSDVVCNFRLLKDKIQNLFQLQNNYFEMKWKDSDNDLIYMSSDEELAQAIANAEDGLLRVYLYPKDGVHTEPKTPEVAEGGGIEHPLVTCDGCEKNLFGDRYKCLQCQNFDLCSTCNAAKKHPDHDMIKLVRPSYVPREWVFWGARKMWKSMFGLCPASYFSHCQKKQESSSSKPTESPENSRKPSPQGFPGLFTNFMNADLAEAQKLFNEGIENLMNIMPGGIEVKLEQRPCKAECKAKTSPKKPKAKKPESAETSTNTRPEEKVEIPAATPDIQTQPKKEVIAETADNPVEQKDKIAETVPVEPKAKIAEPVPTPKAKVDEVKASTEETTSKTDESREPSPSSDIETSTCPDGWTFIQEDESTKQEPVCAAAEIPTEAVKEVKYPKLEEIRDKIEAGNMIQTNDPKIINALIKMQAMGFTNEGGWLERLLVTKHGNINEALDALYPFTQRH